MVLREGGNERLMLRWARGGKFITYCFDKTEEIWNTLLRGVFHIENTLQ